MPARTDVTPLRVRGLHVAAPEKKDFDRLVRFVREALPREGVNTLVVEFGYRFAFRSRPEVAKAEAAAAHTEARRLVAACREAGVTLIPQINCLGHQGHLTDPGPLLRAHPDFDETPHLNGDEKDFYCKSWCPLHPALHRVVFDLIDELCDACESTAFHAGMDEVFIIADDRCPRCKGKTPADLFAAEVNRIHEHLAATGRRLWMWGDRFIEAKRWSIDKWSASDNDTWPAIDKVPTDIIVCDWHYHKVPATARYFIEKGFATVRSPWRDPRVALGHLEMMDALACDPNPEVARRAWGVLATTWCAFTSFADAYAARPVLDEPPVAAANCFRALFAALRGDLPFRGYAPPKK